MRTLNSYVCMHEYRCSDFDFAPTGFNSCAHGICMYACMHVCVYASSNVNQSGIFRCISRYVYSRMCSRQTFLVCMNSCLHACLCISGRHIDTRPGWYVCMHACMQACDVFLSDAHTLHTQPCATVAAAY